jgi:death-on-curing protein
LRNEPLWLPKGEVIQTNQTVVEISGEPFFLRDEGLLESACARPINSWRYGEDDMANLAVALLLGIARNHAFEQGNKRTGFVSSLLFLNLNGLDLGPIDSREFGDLISGAVENKIEDQALSEVIRDALQPLA